MLIVAEWLALLGLIILLAYCSRNVALSRVLAILFGSSDGFIVAASVCIWLGPERLTHSSAQVMLAVLLIAGMLVASLALSSPSESVPDLGNDGFRWQRPVL